MPVLNEKKYRLSAALLFALLACPFVVMLQRANGAYSPSSPTAHKKRIFSRTIPTAAPALVTAGRNIAFESANSLANAPASYLNLLDCCESDEAIAERLALGTLQAVVIPKPGANTVR